MFDFGFVAVTVSSHFDPEIRRHNLEITIRQKDGFPAWVKVADWFGFWEISGVCGRGYWAEV